MLRLKVLRAIANRISRSAGHKDKQCLRLSVDAESGRDLPLRMGQKSTRYVLLCYAPAAMPGIPVLIVEGEASLEVRLPINWKNGLHADDRDYLAELISDWQEAEADRMHGILDELSELCVGPLRARESGLADATRRAELHKIIERDDSQHRQPKGGPGSAYGGFC